MKCNLCGWVSAASSVFCEQCGNRLGSPADGGTHLWTVGRNPECDITVDSPAVSEYHCLLSKNGDTFLIEDLSSSNGTFVNGERVMDPVAVSREDRITLGHETVFPWPAGISQRERVITVGRSPDSDVVLDFPNISWEHARVIEDESGLTIEDRGSLNGTAIHSLSNRITRSPVSPSDTVFFGSYRVKASQLLSKRRMAVGESPHETLELTQNVIVIGRDPGCDYPVDDSMVSWQHARVSRSTGRLTVTDLGSLNGTFVNSRKISGSTVLNPGDVLVIGSNTIRISAEGTLQRQNYQGNMTLELREVGVPNILSPTSFTVYPAELVGIMGSSGAGKTTLLNAITGYSPPSGNVLINGLDLYANYELFRGKIGYVPQEDIMHAQLTVREALYYTARLRTDLKDSEIAALIGRVTEDLEISDCLDRLIGSPERKVISGGQRRRVNVAMELVSSPALLLLDEPTSGLSSEDADNVLRILKKIAQNGSTVMLTIHQPSLDIFRQLDGLVVLGRRSPELGRLVYYGPTYPDSLDFFNREGCERKRRAGQEPGPELLFKGLEGSRDGGGKVSLSEWASKYEQSPYKKSYIDQRARSGGPQPHAAAQAGSADTVRKGGLRHILPLIRRNMKVKLRDGLQTYIMIVQAPIFAGLLALVFGNLADHAQAFSDLGEWRQYISEIGSIHFLMVVSAVWFGCNNSARDIVGEWTVYRRERMTSLTIPSYIVSKFTVLAGFSAVQCAILLGLVTALCRLDSPLPETYGILLLSSLVGVAMGLCISALSKTTASAIAALPIVILPLIVLGGGIQPLHRLDWMRYAAAAAPTRWAFEANLLSEADRRTSRYEGSVCQPYEDAINGVQDQLVQCSATLARVTQQPPPAAPAPRTPPTDIETDAAATHFPADKPRTALGMSATYLGGMVLAYIVFLGVVLKMRDIR